MKKINLLLLCMSCCSLLFAQKEIDYHGTSVTIDGKLVSTFHTLNNNTADGTKEIYSYYNELYNMYTFTELNTDKDGKYNSIYKYTINADNIEKNSCYVVEKQNNGFMETTYFAAKIGLKTGASTVVQSMIGSENEWNYSKEPAMLVYFTSKMDAEELISRITK